MSDSIERDEKWAMLVLKALWDTVCEAGPEGAPSGSLYLACQHFNMNLETYQSLMNFLEAKGLVVCRNHCYYKKEAKL